MDLKDSMTSMVEVAKEQGFTVESNCQEERIYVAIRVRPLNEKERARLDASEWECISHNTIRFKNNGHAEQRSATDTYTFDRVFGDKCTTQEVYEQAIKEVALSVVRGINSSIFAYGQTSSGKTYTMTGITEQSVRDIYEYIEKHKEREFVVKFSAMEIYNEAVRDLLNSNATSLRLLDDPEKGTIVEKLTEETLTERSQLQQLLSICAAERTTEETAMNETSSRSHQILRLTVESNQSNFVGTRSGTLVASVNFVDLAGSERASQALSAGTRLREGSHINRSLLTLGTVIRKLSKERNGHIPYRDSKLTRILHNSLGGNSRTAIICTINPARSQVEQSKNTLFFAGCAKQVATNARVNVLLSDKVLVKQLQKELARMEDELRSLNTTILKERELKIEQMDKEIKELTRQRDLFQSHVENLLQSTGKDRLLRLDKDWVPESSGVSNDLHPGADSTSKNLDRTTSRLSISNEHLSQKPENSDENFLLDGCPPTFFGPDPCKGWEEMTSRAESEDNCEEVPRIEIREVETEHKTNINTSTPDFEEREANSPMIEFVDLDAKSSSSHGQRDQVAVKQKTQVLHRTKEPLVLSEKSNSSSESEPHSLAATSLDSPPRIDKVDQEIPLHPQSSKMEQNVSPPQFNMLNQKPESPHQSDKKEHKTMLPPQLDEREQMSITSPAGDEREYSTSLVSFHEKLSERKSCKMEQNVPPPWFNMLNQKPESPHQSDKKEHKTMLPPQLDEREQMSITSPAGDEREYSKSLVSFPKKLSERKSSMMEQNVPPPWFNMLNQKPESPHQSDKQEHKTMLPPQLDEREQTSVTSPAGDEREYSTSLVSFPEKVFERKSRTKGRKHSKKHPLVHEKDASAKDLESVMDSDEEDNASVLNFVVRMNEKTKPKSADKDFDNLMVPSKTSGVNKRVNRVKGISLHGISGALIPSKFERQQRDIIELWNACNVPLVHRSYFFLLIKGELSDSVYLDVELRRLSFLEDAFSRGKYIPGEETLDVTPNSSYSLLQTTSSRTKPRGIWLLTSEKYEACDHVMRHDDRQMALTRERKMLSKQVHKKFSRKEREDQYRRWGIDLKTKHRSIQLAWLVWTSTKDFTHVRESAELVAKLVGFINTGESPKKTFGFGFLSRRKSKKWQDTMTTL